MSSYWKLLALSAVLIAAPMAAAVESGDKADRVAVDLKVGTGEKLFIDGNLVSVSEFLAETRRWRKLRGVDVNISVDSGATEERLWQAYFATKAAQIDIDIQNHTANREGSQSAPSIAVNLAPGLEEIIAKAPIVEGQEFSEDAWYSCEFGMYHDLYDPARAAHDAKVTFDRGVYTLIKTHFAFGGYSRRGMEGYWRAPQGVSITHEMLDAGGDAFTRFCLDVDIGNTDFDYAIRFNRAMRTLIDQQAIREKNIQPEDARIVWKAQERLATYLPDKPAMQHPEFSRALWEMAVFDDPFVVFEYGGGQRGIMFSSSTGLPVEVGSISVAPGCEESSEDIALYMRSCAPRVRAKQVGLSLPGYTREELEEVVCNLVREKPFMEQRWARGLRPAHSEYSEPDIVFLSSHPRCRRPEDGFQKREWGYSVNVLPGYVRTTAMSARPELKKFLTVFSKAVDKLNKESPE